MSRAVLILLLAAAFCGRLHAHTVPVVVIEAEFNSSREAVIKVNLDPRLFLSEQPTAVPPVPASWWFEQDEQAQQNTMKAAADYVARIFAFRVGTTQLQGDWKVAPIDSASAFPLGQASTEAHLLVEHRGALPASPGDFKVAVGKECAVAVILLCSNTGDEERKPQSLFPGEISRAFPLPSLAAPAPETTAVANPQEPGGSWLTRLAWWGGLFWNGHFAWDHLALAALVGLALSRRGAIMFTLLPAFHGMNRLAASAVFSGWLPHAPVWMTVAYWIALALTASYLFSRNSTTWSLLATIAVAGLCHGLNATHLHFGPAASSAFTLMIQQDGVLLVAELAVVIICASLAHLVHRPRPSPPCSSAA
jgi:hypothetical protein